MADKRKPDEFTDLAPELQKKLNLVGFSSTSGSINKSHPWFQDRDIFSLIVSSGYVTGRLTSFDIHYISKVTKVTKEVCDEIHAGSFWHNLFLLKEKEFPKNPDIYYQEDRPEYRFTGVFLLPETVEVVGFDYRRLVISIEVASREIFWAKFKFEECDIMFNLRDGKCSLTYTETTSEGKKRDIRLSMYGVFNSWFESSVFSVAPDSFDIILGDDLELGNKVQFVYRLMNVGFYIGDDSEIGTPPNLFIDTCIDNPTYAESDYSTRKKELY